MRTTTVLTALVALLALSAPASAQIGFGGASQPVGATGAAPTPLTPDEMKANPPTFNISGGGNNGVGFMPMIFAFAFMGIMLGVNLLPCKRGHQD